MLHVLQTGDVTLHTKHVTTEIAMTDARTNCRATRILLLPGDGIGPEVTAQSERIIAHFQATENVDFIVESDAIGGAAIDAYSTPLAEATLAKAMASDAVLMGSVGGPAWETARAYDQRPEAGLLRLRAGMNAYANLRPAICFDALVPASTLKAEIVAGLDIMFVRELTGGVYFGEPRGISALANGERQGLNTHRYTSSEIRRVARIAFALARTRSGRVCSVDKANVMDAGRLWREEVTALHAEQFADVALDHMLADNCSMQLVRNPRQFDVILTDNLFGDLLSDTAAMLTGSIGMLPSAAIGDPGRPGLYEPIHGSAPDIAGQGIANPCASILSLAMAFRYSLERVDLAESIERAVRTVLDHGVRTRDLGGTATTMEMGNAILAALQTPACATSYHARAG